MPLYWLERELADLPGGEDWLAEPELACFRKRWVSKRRSDWLLGRWTAKCALAQFLELREAPEDFRKLSIVPDDLGAPVASMGDVPLSLSLSISHSEGRAFVVVDSQGEPIGCDLERIVHRSCGFVNDFFTRSEIQQLEQSKGDKMLGTDTLIWSAKECVLKVMRVGLREDTRDVSIQVVNANNESEWEQFSAVVLGKYRFYGWWHRTAGWVRAVAASTERFSPVPAASGIRRMSPCTKFVQS